MNLVRKYKISKIINKPLEGVEREIIDFIHSWLKDLIPFKWDKYSDSIFYMSPSGLYVLEQDKKFDTLWVRWKDFWEVLSNKYSINNPYIQPLLKLMIDEAFKKHRILPCFTSLLISPLIDEALKQQTNTCFKKIFYETIEVAFKENI